MHMYRYSSPLLMFVKHESPLFFNLFKVAEITDTHEDDKKIN